MEQPYIKKAYVKYIMALLLFGSNGIVASHISLSSLEIVLLRALIGSLFLLAIFFFSKERFTFWKNKHHFIFLLISGMAMGASWMFLYEAYQQIGVSLASLAYYCGPVIVMALSPLLFKESLTRAKLIGFSLVLCGIIMINGEALQDGKTGWGLFMGGMSAVMLACMVIFNKKAESITGLENSVMQLIISFMTVATFVGFRQGFAMEIHSQDWLPILILGLVNTGIGCYLYFSSMRCLPVQSIAVLGYLEPLSAVVFSVIILHEIMLPFQLLGAVLLLGGAAYAELRAVPSRIKTSPSLPTDIPRL